MFSFLENVGSTSDLIVFVKKNSRSERIHEDVLENVFQIYFSFFRSELVHSLKSVFEWIFHFRFIFLLKIYICLTKIVFGEHSILDLRLVFKVYLLFLKMFFIQKYCSWFQIFILSLDLESSSLKIFFCCYWF